MFSEEIKKKLIDFIYNSVNLNDYKFQVIKDETHLHEIKKDFYVCRNYVGMNSLLIFKKIRDTFCSVIINKQTLSFTRLNVKMENVEIIPVGLRMGKDIYKGTIFDGIFLNGGQDKTFMIHDCYKFEGESMIGMNLLHKNLKISAYLNSKFKKDMEINTIRLKINKFYELKDTRKLIESVGNLRGLAIYPNRSGTKYILTNTKIETIEEKKEKEYEEIEDGKEAVLMAKKTEKSDVYDLYLSVIVEKEGKKRISLKKVPSEIAYIPNLECSRMCSEIFEDNMKQLLICKYVKDKCKWMPLGLCKTKTKPNKFSDIYKLKDIK